MYYLFYIPVGTEARVRGTPWGTIALACVNLGAFVFFQSAPGFEPDFYRLALHPGAPSVLTSITSSFLHAGWIHLLSNLLYLGIFAPPIESRIGTPRFLACYLCFAGLANLAQAGWMLAATPELASMPILGSSGAVAGVMGLFLVRLYFVRLRFAAVTLLYLQGISRANKFALPAVVAIVLWFVLQGVYQLVQPVEGTAYISHLSGLGIGTGSRIRSGEVDEACDAFEEMKRLLGDVSIPSGHLLRIARCYEERGRPSDASRAYEAYGRHYPEAPGAATALLKCVDIERRVLNNPGRAQYVCRELLRLPLQPDVERLARERLRAVEEALAVQRRGAA